MKNTFNLLLLAGLMYFGASAAKAQTVQSGHYTIVAKHSNKCLGVSNSSNDDNAVVQQWTCDGGFNQNWLIRPTADGYYTVRSAHSGKSLKIKDGSRGAGAPLVQFSDHGEESQQFSMMPAGGEFYNIVPRHSGKTLGVCYSSKEDGSCVVQWPPTGVDDQKFKLKVAKPVVETGVYTIAAKHSNKCLDVPSGRADENLGIIQWGCWDGANQKWIVRAGAGGYYTFTSMSNGKNLKIKDGDSNGGARLVQFSAGNEYSQRFDLIPVGDGFYNIVAKHSGKLLDVYAHNQANGATIVQWWNTGTDNQRFKLNRQADEVRELKSSSVTEERGVKQISFADQVMDVTRTIGPQNAYLKMNLSGKLAVHNGQKFLHLDTQGSRISADKDGKLQFDDPTQRGYYLESVGVTMRPLDSRLLMKKDAPVTTEGSGSVTSSVSIDLSAGSGEIGGGLSFGKSYSEDLFDFKVVNTSDAIQARQAYKLASTNYPGGGKVKYGQWKDLVGYYFFSGYFLNEIPDLAKSGLPLLSQAIWLAESDLSAPMVFEITFTADVRYVVCVDYWTNYFTMTATDSVTFKKLIVVDLGAVN